MVDPEPARIPLRSLIRGTNRSQSHRSQNRTEDESRAIADENSAIADESPAIANDDPVVSNDSRAMVISNRAAEFSNTTSLSNETTSGTEPAPEMEPVEAESDLSAEEDASAEPETEPIFDSETATHSTAASGAAAASAAYEIDLIPEADVPAGPDAELNSWAPRTAGELNDPQFGEHLCEPIQRAVSALTNHELQRILHPRNIDLDPNTSYALERVATLSDSLSNSRDSKPNNAGYFCLFREFKRRCPEVQRGGFSEMWLQRIVYMQDVPSHILNHEFSKAEEHRHPAFNYRQEDLNFMSLTLAMRDFSRGASLESSGMAAWGFRRLH